MEFSIWGANLSGGFLRANVAQDRDGSLAYNEKLIKLADSLHVESILFPVRYTGNIGGGETESGQLDPLIMAGGLAAETKQIHLIAAVLPGFIHPATLAKLGATIDILSNGRFHINLVSGWFKAEQEMFGLDWIPHEERYNRSEEYLQVLQGLWTTDRFSFKGDYYEIQEATLTPKPIQKPYPAIYQGGNSPAAQEMAGRLADYYFMNGAPVEELTAQISTVQKVASKYGRNVKFAVNAFVIAREDAEQAQAELDHIIKNADETAIAQQKERTFAKGMWKNATTTLDLVANNEGLRTGLIGSYAEIADKINELRRIGIDKILLTFRHPLEELPLFYQKVVPLLQARRETQDVPN